MGAASFTAVAEEKNMSDAKADNNPRIGPESAQKTLLADEIFASLAIVTPPTNGSIITDTFLHPHILNAAKCPISWARIVMNIISANTASQKIEPNIINNAQLKTNTSQLIRRRLLFC